MHVNLFKKYHERSKPIVTIAKTEVVLEKNSDILGHFSDTNKNLEASKVKDLQNLLSKFPEVVKDNLGLTDV